MNNDRLDFYKLFNEVLELNNISKENILQNVLQESVELQNILELDKILEKERTSFKSNEYTKLNELIASLRLSELVGKIVEESQRHLSYYRQRKEDLIARIATDWPKWACSVDFYSFFIQPLLRNPFVFHFINISDGISLSQIIIKYGFADDKNEISWTKIKMELLTKGETKIIENPDMADFTFLFLDKIKLREGEYIEIRQNLENLKSSFVRVRSADIGAQAFFLFLEGLIRNSGKHRIRSHKKDILELKIVFFEDKKKFERFIQNEKDDIKLEEDKDCAYVLISSSLDLLKDNNGNKILIAEGERNYNLLEYLRKGICSEIIDERGQITSGNWGLKEMKICSAFLSGADQNEVNLKNPNYIWIIECPKRIWNDENERFAYVIKLEKPRYILCIVDENNKPKNLSDWKSRGINFITINEIDNANYDYDFVFFDRSINEQRIIKEINEKRSILPQRKVISNININEDMENFFNKIYDLYLEELIRKTGVDKFKIIIFFDDEKKANEWNSWYEKIKSGRKSIFNTGQLEFIFPCKKEELDYFLRDRSCYKICLFRHIGIKGLAKPNYSRSNCKVYCREFVSYSDHFFSFLYNIDPEKLGNLIIRQFIESALMNTLIIDERAAQVAGNYVSDNGEKVSLKEKLYWMGIYVVKAINNRGKIIFRFIDEDEKMTSRLKDEPKRLIEIDMENILSSNKQFTIEEFPINILLIHATILKKLASEFKKKNDELINIFNQKIPFVIVHSGRGKTKGEIPHNAAFLEYSIIQRHLIQEPSKFFLTQIALTSKGG